jgi:hypothetical protein
VAHFRAPPVLCRRAGARRRVSGGPADVACHGAPPGPTLGR